MNILNCSVPSELIYILHILPSGIYTTCDEFRFHLELNDNNLYLALTGWNISELIPNSIVREIIGNASKNPKSSLYFFSQGILPIKKKLIHRTLKENNICLDELFFNGSGYAEKKDGVVLFFDKGSLSVNDLNRRHPSFVITKHVYKRADNSYIVTGDSGCTSFFLYYPINDTILRLDTMYDRGTFRIERINKCATMQYLQMYKNNRSSLDIYKINSDSSNKMLRKLFK